MGRAYTHRPVTATVPVRADPLAPFSRPVREWFEASFEAPTDAQARGWAAIAAGQQHADPRSHRERARPSRHSCGRWTGSPPIRRPERTTGPTRHGPGAVRLAAQGPDLRRRAQPACAAHRHRPRGAAPRRAEPPTITVASRTGDTPSEDRREIARHPPDILITTPESLYLMLTSQAREVLRGVEHVIVDEVHAIAGTKRGAHLALSLERLERSPPGGRRAASQRIGLTRHATAARRDRAVPRRRRVRTARSRSSTPARASRSTSRWSCRSTTWPPSARSCRSTSSPAARRPARTCGPASGRRSTRGSSSSSASHTSTIVFTNSRRLSERLAQRLNELAGEDLVKAHHGSIAREQRLAIEEDLKAGRLPALVATSSLELGIDMGAVDLVIQVESPTSVARGLQRVGRAGHQVGAPSKGVIFPKYRGDLLEVRGRDPADARRRHRGDRHPAQPARRPRPAARRDDGHGPLDGRRTCSRRSPGRRRTRR